MGPVILQLAQRDSGTNTPPPVETVFDSGDGNTLRAAVALAGGPALPQVSRVALVATVSLRAPVGVSEMLVYKLEMNETKWTRSDLNYPSLEGASFGRCFTIFKHGSFLNNRGST